MKPEEALMRAEGLLESAFLSLEDVPDGIVVEAKGYLRQLMERLDADGDLGRALNPEVLAEGWAAKGNPFKVRTPKGHPSDVPVAIIEWPAKEGE